MKLSGIDIMAFLVFVVVLVAIVALMIAGRDVPDYFEAAFMLALGAILKTTVTAKFETKP